jgi:glycosyltransferase involved in cell wall biosynthesis
MSNLAPIQVALDAKRMFLNYSGLGNYSRTLLKNLLRHQSGFHYHLLTPEIRTHDQLAFLDTYASAVSTSVLPGIKNLNRLYPSPSWIKQKHAQIYHGLSNELPFNVNKLGTRNVVTIHDVIFLRYPELYKPIDRTIYRFKTKKACSDADVIIAVSEQTKSDLIYFLQVPPEKIQVIYQSCDELYTTTANAQLIEGVRNNYNLPKQYLLYVGTIEPRKNLMTIIQALKLLKGKMTLPLVVIGKSTDYKQKVVRYLKNFSLESKVLFLENVPLAHMPAIFQQAECFIYPSTFEGFGIPIIEALYSKVPVITSTGSCFAEAGGPQSIYTRAGDVLQLAEAIESVTSDGTLRKSMSELGWQYVQRFNGSVTSSQLSTLYHSLIR